VSEASTLGCIQPEALNHRFASPSAARGFASIRYEMVDENVRFNLNKQQTAVHEVTVERSEHIDEDKNSPERETS
jgi:hypothetical protein